MGRPKGRKKESADSLSFTLPAVRCTSEDFEKIKAKQKEAGKKNTSEFIRSMLLEGKVEHVTRMAIEDNPSSIVFQLKKIGTNINQIARSSNRGREFDIDYIALRDRIDNVLHMFIQKHISDGT